jgi:hypothetical protein
MKVQGFLESGCVFRETPFLSLGFHGIKYCRAGVALGNCKAVGIAQRALSLPPIANSHRVQSWTDLRRVVIAVYFNEKERTHAQTIILCPLSHVWCSSTEALCAAFRSSALGATRRPEVCRRRSHREEIRLNPNLSDNRTSPVLMSNLEHRSKSKRGI